MNIYTLCLTHAYVAFNFFITGREYEWYEWRDNWPGAALKFLYTTLFAAPIAVCILIWGVFYKLCEYLHRQFQAKFFLTYYAKGWRNMDEQLLYAANQRMRIKEDSKQIRDRIYCFVVRKLNRWNNYTFAERQPDF